MGHATSAQALEYLANDIPEHYYRRASAESAAGRNDAILTALAGGAIYTIGTAPHIGDHPILAMGAGVICAAAMLTIGPTVPRRFRRAHEYKNLAKNWRPEAGLATYFVYDPLINHKDFTCTRHPLKEQQKSMIEVRPYADLADIPRQDTDADKDYFFGFINGVRYHLTESTDTIDIRVERNGKPESEPRFTIIGYASTATLEVQTREGIQEITVPNQSWLHGEEAPDALAITAVIKKDGTLVPALILPAFDVDTYYSWRKKVPSLAERTDLAWKPTLVPQGAR